MISERVLAGKEALGALGWGLVLVLPGLSSRLVYPGGMMVMILSEIKIRNVLCTRQYGSVSHALFSHLFHVYECFPCMNVCEPHACLVFTEVGRGHWIPWNWGYGWL